MAEEAEGLNSPPRPLCGPGKEAASLQRSSREREEGERPVPDERTSERTSERASAHPPADGENALHRLFHAILRSLLSSAPPPVASWVSRRS
ncbi:hypothetical protein SKAU_G00365410 [Synaphobranchus kaupii]|uniref:Uncharacterized protein n=1 Tax=Synaphobranchus kaupii TaxID=118154 RepID=A0A9Q1IEG5_SYNKA|nr:hypothetical protein SKAU_G00365410 [Synaphobranchus kaupii]